jgi:hypothetical protein
MPLLILAVAEVPVTIRVQSTVLTRGLTARGCLFADHWGCGTSSREMNYVLNTTVHFNIRHQNVAELLPPENANSTP